MLLNIPENARATMQPAVLRNDDLLHQLARDILNMMRDLSERESSHGIYLLLLLFGRGGEEDCAGIEK